VLFEPINEPWGYTTPQYGGAQYADVIAALLPAARAAGIPLDDIYVAATGKGCTATGECMSNGWLTSMYAACEVVWPELLAAGEHRPDAGCRCGSA